MKRIFLVCIVFALGACASARVPPSNAEAVLGPAVEGKLTGSNDIKWLPYSAYTSGSPVLATEAYVASKVGGQNNFTTTATPKLTLAKYTEGGGHKDAPKWGTTEVQYLQIGGLEYAAASVYGIGMGFVYTQPGQFAPTFIGYQEGSTSGNTNGDIFFATRPGTTNIAPLSRLRITALGDIKGESSYVPTTPQSLTTKAYVDGLQHPVMPALGDAVDTPTKDDWNALLKDLRNAGLMAQ